MYISKTYFLGYEIFSLQQSLWDIEQRMNVNDELRMGKEVVMTYFKVLTQYLPGGTEENHKEPQSWKVPSRPRIIYGTYKYKAAMLFDCDIW